MNSKIALALLIIIMTGCNDTQMGHAAKAIISNTFSSGIDPKASAQAYNSVKSNTIAHNSAVSSGPTQNTSANPNCIGDSTGILGKGQLESFTNVKNSICSCKSWGNCDSQSCECSVLCPANFNIFDRPSYSNGTKVESSLAVSNAKYSTNDLYAGDWNSQGYCWGIASIEQKFNRLAAFNPSAPAKFQNQADERERRKYYQEIIENILANRPVDIPGFKGLREFSSDPEVRDLLLPAVKKEWASNAMSGQGLGIVTSSSAQDMSVYKEVFDSLEYRTKNFQSPVLTFNQVGNGTYAHTIMISSVETLPNGDRKACSIDSNRPVLSNSACENYFLLKPTGEMLYYELNQFSLRVAQFQIAKAEDAHTVEQVKNLVQKCQNEKGCKS